jgi:macrolide transport system ATP-binding/permease protein
VDLGFDPDRVLVVNASLPPFRSAGQASVFCQRMVEEVERIHGVRAAGAINYFFSSEDLMNSITIEGGAAGRRDVPFDQVTIDGHLFQAAGVRLLRGRHLSPGDIQDAAAPAVISDSAAQAFWPGQDPIGKRFRTRRTSASWMTVVGVVADLRRHGIESTPVPQIFVPGNQKRIDLMVRTLADPRTLGPEVRQLLLSLDPTMKVTGITSLVEQMDAMAAQRRFQTLVLGVFSAVSLILAAIGIYGLMRYSVTQRTREIGIRMALGASARDVSVLVVRQGLAWAVAGIVVGLLSATLLTRTLKSFVFGIGTSDPITLAGVSGVLICAAALACYLPIRKATRIDPLVALRYE